MKVYITVESYPNDATVEDNNFVRVRAFTTKEECKAYFAKVIDEYCKKLHGLCALDINRIKVCGSFHNGYNGSSIVMKETHLEGFE